MRKLINDSRILYGILFIGGMLCLAFAAYQTQYSRLVAAGNRAVAEKRFDTQAYTQASRYWLANQKLLLYNQGVLNYEAQNFSRAADLFRQAYQTDNRLLRKRALYNLGVVLLALEEPEGAAEMFKEALRIDPSDPEVKFNLERLYHFVLLEKGGQAKASLQQAPGLHKEEGKGLGKEGAGRPSPRSDI
ncbi:MAG: tetratricopeptide repeat protein [Nitrospinota bacterium]|nr:MAG: tetratricopeptide repeat protein [Nitrospinota bacterium]